MGNHVEKCSKERNHNRKSGFVVDKGGMPR